MHVGVHLCKGLCLCMHTCVSICMCENVCMCVCVRVNESMCVCLCTNVHVSIHVLRLKKSLGVIFVGPPATLKQGSLAHSPPIRVDWLTSETQECTSPASTSVLELPVFRWQLRVEPKSSMPTKQSVSLSMESPQLQHL